MKNEVLMGLAIVISVALLTGCSKESKDKEKFCRTNSISLNKVSPYYDGQWQGIIAASDGACYFGSSSHTLIHGGGLFRFDPATKQFDVLTDDKNSIIMICGNDELVVYHDMINVPGIF